METKKIVHSLRCCISAESCKSCDFFDIQQCGLSLKKIAANRLEELEAEIAELKKQLSEKPEWVSVEERLPKEFLKLYFVYRKRGKITLSTYYPNKVWNYDDVAYWMPFPGFPKPKKPTFKDVFLKAFPKTKIEQGIPKACVEYIFPWGKYPHCNSRNCDKCWNQPYFEEEGGE